MLRDTASNKTKASTTNKMVPPLSTIKGLGANPAEKTTVTPPQLSEEPKGLKLSDADTKISAKRTKAATQKTPNAELNQQSNGRWYQQLNDNQTKVEALHPPEEPNTIMMDMAKIVATRGA